MRARKLLTRTIRAVRPPYPEIGRLMAGYRESQWRMPGEIADSQQESLEVLLAHARARVPFYRERLPEGGAPLSDLPVLTKADLRASFESLKSDDLAARSWFTNRSGGSTGEPVTLVQDREYLLRSEAKKAVAFEWAGYEPGDAMVRLWGSERDILEGGDGWRARVAALANNRVTLNAFRMTPAQMREFLRIIGTTRPRAVYAYTTAAYEIARFALREGIRISPPGSVIVTSGTLHPFMRESIRSAFGCPVFDQYGSREVSCIASECDRHEGLHLNAETLVLEVVDGRGRPCAPGVEGDILVTSLVNRAMPLVRYRIGDRGALAAAPCSCGRGLPLLARVAGRGMDAFRRRDGTIVPGEYFIHFLGVVFNRGYLEKVQVVQQDYERALVRIVPTSEPVAPEALAEIERTVRMALGPEARAEIRVEKDIPPEPSGKFRYTKCEIQEG